GGTRRRCGQPHCSGTGVASCRTPARILRYRLAGAFRGCAVLAAGAFGALTLTVVAVSAVPFFSADIETRSPALTSPSAMVFPAFSIFVLASTDTIVSFLLLVMVSADASTDFTVPDIF